MWRCDGRFFPETRSPDFLFPYVHLNPEWVLRPLTASLLAKMLSRTVLATRAAAASTGKREFSALFTAVDEFPG